MSKAGPTTVGLFDADSAVLARKRLELAAIPDLDVRIAAGTLGQMLTDPEFPTDVVIVEQRPGERVSIDYKVRVCRLADARVIVISNGIETPGGRVGQLMTPVGSFAEAIALISG